MGASLLVVALALGQPAPKPTLARAVAYFNDFDDAHARTELEALLRHPQPRLVAAKAHLYLGLIAMNHVDVDTSLQEFRRALEIDPALEMVLEASPKARLTFEEARREVTSVLESGAFGAPASGSVPAAAVEAAPAPPARSHALGISLTVTGLVLLGVMGVSIYEVVSYTNGLAGHAFNPSADATAHAFEYTQYIAGALGVAGVTAGALVW
ncbi:MAG TPA: hypothetical protein VMB50_19780 [Myxococcales bacterium]|nr:hypothetical protein [Myxococcales bacterium]